MDGYYAIYAPKGDGTESGFRVADESERPDPVGYLHIGNYGDFSEVRFYDERFHEVEFRRIDMAQSSPGFDDAAGFRRDRMYLIMDANTFFRKRTSSRQKEYRERRKQKQRMDTIRKAAKTYLAQLEGGGLMGAGRVAEQAGRYTVKKEGIER